MIQTTREATAMSLPALTMPAGTRVRCLRTGDLGTTATAYDPSDPWLSSSSDPRRASVSFVADNPLRSHSPQRDELVSDLQAV